MARRIGLPALIVATLMIASLPLHAQAPTPPSSSSAAGARAVAELRWLAGCWERRTGAMVIEEHWLTPRAGLMLGVGRTVRNDTVAVEHEFLRIFARGDTLVYAAHPSGQPPAEFVARSRSSAREVVFENPSHDFPQRIHYAAVGSDSLNARIEGVRAGKLRSVDFPYRRVACP